MTIQEAIREMKMGKKITHTYFLPEEWMTLNDNIFIFNDGAQCHPEDFWKYRQFSAWKIGYSIWNKNSINK
jgi:hypothetical protein